MDEDFLNGNIFNDRIVVSKQEAGNIDIEHMERGKHETVFKVNVTDDLEKIYFKLSQPLQQLEDERWRDNCIS